MPLNTTQYLAGLSPRGRGSPLPRDVGDFDAGSIPAWAGEPPRHALDQRRVKVYPRVGGGAATISRHF